MSANKPGRLRGLITVGLGYLVNTGQELSLPLIFPAIRDSFTPALTNANLAFIDGARIIVQTLLSPLWGMAADRFSRKTVLVVGTGLWGGLTIFCGLSTQYWHLLAAWVAACVGLGALVPAGFGMIADLYGPDERGKAIGILNAMGMSGIIVFALLSNPFLSETGPGWRAFFVFIGACSIAVALVIAAFVREPPRGGAEPELLGMEADLAAARFKFRLADIAEVLRSGTVWLAYLQGFFGLSAMYLVMRFFTTWLVDERGFKEEDAPLVFAGVVVALVAGSVVGGFLADWAERKSPARGRAVFAQAGFALMLPSMLMALLVAERDWAIVAWSLAATFFVEWPRRGALQPMIQNVTRPELRGTALAMAEFFQGGMASVAIYFMAIVSDTAGLAATMAWACGVFWTLAFISGFGFYLTSPRYPEEVAAIRREMSDRRDQLSAGPAGGTAGEGGTAGGRAGEGGTDGGGGDGRQ